MFPKSNDYLHFIDVETCGFSYTKSSVIALAWVTTDQDYNKLGEFYVECMPEKGSYWNKNSERVHRLTQAHLRKTNTPAKACGLLLDYLKQYEQALPCEVVFHANNKFDPRWVESMFWKNDLDGLWPLRKVMNFNNCTSTLALAKEKLPALENHKLNTLCDYFGLELNHHHALSDTRVLPTIYKKLREME